MEHSIKGGEKGGENGGPIFPPNGHFHFLVINMTWTENAI
jgi:hypothetical protein